MENNEQNDLIASLPSGVQEHALFGQSMRTMLNKDIRSNLAITVAQSYDIWEKSFPNLSPDDYIANIKDFKSYLNQEKGLAVARKIKKQKKDAPASDPLINQSEVEAIHKLSSITLSKLEIKNVTCNVQSTYSKQIIQAISQDGIDEAQRFATHSLFGYFLCITGIAAAASLAIRNPQVTTAVLQSPTVHGEALMAGVGFSLYAGLNKLYERIGNINAHKTHKLTINPIKFNNNLSEE